MISRESEADLYGSDYQSVWIIWILINLFSVLLINLFS